MNPDSLDLVVVLAPVFGLLGVARLALTCFTGELVRRPGLGAAGHVTLDHGNALPLFARLS